MPFMVIYRTSDGGSCYEQADAIDEAALLVERLRNRDGLDEIRIYRMEEISFAFRPYYKVELGLAERQSASPSAVTAAGLAEQPTREPVVEPEPHVDAPPRRTEVTLEHQPDEAVSERSAPPAPDPDNETASANGRRGLFGR
jgi:hypothetical protein